MSSLVFHHLALAGVLGFALSCSPSHDPRRPSVSQLSPKGVVRLTPEQLSNRIYRALDYRLEQESPFGPLDQITYRYGVTLGGIDGESVRVPDRSTRVSVLLVGRHIVLQVALFFVLRELDPKLQKVMKVGKFGIDRPFMPEDQKRSAAEQILIQAGEKRWVEQVEILIQRLFSRDVRPEELERIRESFIAMMRSENYPVAEAWILTIYSLLSMKELWLV